MGTWSQQQQTAEDADREWHAVGDIKGPRGPDGPAGPEGPRGPAGSADYDNLQDLTMIFENGLI